MDTQVPKYNSRVDAIKDVLQKNGEPNYRLGQVCSFIFKEPVMFTEPVKL